jgi:hypothetical protein
MGPPARSTGSRTGPPARSTSSSGPRTSGVNFVERRATGAVNLVERAASGAVGLLDRAAQGAVSAVEDAVKLRIGALLLLGNAARFVIEAQWQTIKADWAALSDASAWCNRKLADLGTWLNDNVIQPSWNWLNDQWGAFQAWFKARCPGLVKCWDVFKEWAGTMGGYVALGALAGIGAGHILMASQGNVADTGIINEAQALIAAGKAANMCEALQILMDQAKGNASRKNRIKATQKAKGCRHSRHS